MDKGLQWVSAECHITAESPHLHFLLRAPTLIPARLHIAVGHPSARRQYLRHHRQHNGNHSEFVQPPCPLMSNLMKHPLFPTLCNFFQPALFAPPHNEHIEQLKITPSQLGRKAGRETHQKRTPTWHARSYHQHHI